MLTELTQEFFPKCYNSHCGENDRCANYILRDQFSSENSETPDLFIKSGKILCCGYLKDSIGYAVFDDGFLMTIYEYYENST